MFGQFQISGIEGEGIMKHTMWQNSWVHWLLDGAKLESTFTPGMRDAGSAARGESCTVPAHAMHDWLIILVLHGLLDSPAGTQQMVWEHQLVKNQPWSPTKVLQSW